MPHRLVDGDPSVRAAAAGYDPASRSLRLRLVNGASLALPLAHYPAFAEATDEQLAAVALTPGGEFVRWPALKRQERVPDLVLALLGFSAILERRVPMPPPPPGPKSLLGLLMYREGYLTREQLQGLFQEQMRAQQAGVPVPLGQLALKAGFMTDDQLRHSLGVQETLGKVPPADRGLILYMLEAAATKPSALVAALEAQRTEGGAVEDVLRRHGLLSDHQLTVFRDRQRAAAPTPAPQPAPVAGPAAPAAQAPSQPAAAPPRQDASVKSLLGIILEREDYLNQVQVKAIMAEQERLKAAGKSGTFGELAMKLGFITPEQLKFAIQLQQKLAYAPGERKPLGAILLENGVIKPSQIHLALQKQAASGQRLGEVLIEQGAISEHLLQVFLQMQHPVG